MADLFTSSEKLLFGNNFNDIHDTFARPIYIWKQREQVVISESSNHNFIWNNAPQNTTTEDVIVSGLFNARILYGKKQDKDPFSSAKKDGAEDQVAAELQLGEVRLKLDPTGSAFLGDAKRVTFDDDTFEVISSKRPHGLFTPQYYTYYLKKLN